MASVMAIWSEVFSSCVGEINVSVELRNGDDWLCCGWKYLRFILGSQSGSILSAEVGDGARYWRLVEAGVEYGETIKNPCVGRSLVGL